ncbi:MAG: ribonuclease HII [Alphaproteobacteria bacterium]
MPDYSLEDSLIERLTLSAAAPVAGLDEVGRGPLAGPVVACAVVIDRQTLPPPVADVLDDSKKLSVSKREELYEILARTTRYALGQASVEEIDTMNILQAALLAMQRAFDGLAIRPKAALVDGNRDPGLGCPTDCIVRGDSRSMSIAAASVIAKVTRDRQMADLARIFPGYGWETNVGYGSKAHLAALRELGPTPHHRTSFAPVKDLIDAKV